MLALVCLESADKVPLDVRREDGGFLEQFFLFFWFGGLADEIPGRDVI